MPNFFAHILRVKARTFYKLFIALSSFSLLLSTFTPWIQPLKASAQTGGGSTVTYLPVALTSNNNTALYMQITAQNYVNGKWTYKVEYSRTLNLQASLYITPKTDKTATVALTCSTGSITAALSSGGGNTIGRTGSCTFALNPATRYRLEFYQQPSAGGTLMLRKFFNTLSTTGQPLATSQIPVNAGGTLNSSFVDTPTPTPTPTTVSNSSSCPQGTVVVGMTNSVPPAYICAAPTPTPTPSIARTPTPTPTIVGGSGDMPAAVFASVYSQNPPTGWAYPIEPQKVDIWDLKVQGLGQNSRLTPPPADPTTKELIKNTSSSPCWTGTTDPKVTCDTIGRFSKGDYREVFVYGTTNRNFMSNINIPVLCDDPKLKVETSLNMPPGITYSNRCQAAADSGQKVILGTLLGTPGSAGTFKNDFKFTYTAANGKTSVATTRIYFVIQNSGRIGVSLKDLNGNATTTASLGSRVVINIDQTSSVNAWNDLDIWAVKDGSPTVNPETYVDVAKNTDSRIWLGRYTVDNSYLGCDSSTAGGSGPIRYGCARYSWIVGDSLGQNLTTGNYAIYVTSHLPYVDRDGSVAGLLYGECEIGYPGCNGFVYGGAAFEVKAGSLDPAAQYNPLTANIASFSMLIFNATSTIYNSDGSVAGTPQTDSFGNGSSASQFSGGRCMAGNDSGGVTCSGPNVSNNLKAGQYFKYDWSIKVLGQCSDAGGTYTLYTENEITGNNNNPGGTSVSWGCIKMVNNRKTLIPPSQYPLKDFSGPVQSQIWATGNVVSQYVGQTDTQTSIVRQCSQFLIPGGFDYEPSQGYINSASGSFTSKPLSQFCAAVLKGVSFVQMVNTYINLNGGGSTYASYMMGGMDFGWSCIGINDFDICPDAMNLAKTGLTAQITGGGWFGRPGVCNVPDENHFGNTLNINGGGYSSEARSAGASAANGLIIEYNPAAGSGANTTGSAPGWAFDNVQIIVSGKPPKDLGNSRDPRWLKDLNTTQKFSVSGSSTPVSVACYYSSVNCGPMTYISAPEISGLNPATAYNVTMRFTCNGTNPSGGPNYRDATAILSTENAANTPVVTPPDITPPAGGQTSTSACPDSHVLDSSSADLSCTKNASGQVTINYNVKAAAGSFTYATLSGDDYTTTEPVDLEAGCPTNNGASTCSLPPYTVSGSGTKTASGPTASNYKARLVVNCAGGKWASMGATCSAPTSQTTPNVFNVSNSTCYLPNNYESALGLSCTKGASGASVRYTIPPDWKFDTVRLYGDSLSKVESGCAGGACAYENWNLNRSGSPLAIPSASVPSSINPYWVRMIFDCGANPAPANKWVSIGAQCN